MAEALDLVHRSVPVRHRPAANLTAGETVLWIDTTAYRRAMLFLRQTQNLGTPDVDDIVRFFVDVCYNTAAPYVDSTNNVATAIDGGLPPLTTDILTLTAVANLQVGDEIRIGDEEMLVTAIAGSTVTVRRGYNGTAVVAHAAATDVFRRDVTWTNVARESYLNADDGTAPVAVLTIGEQAAGIDIAADIQADLGADGVRELPLGSRLRVRTTVAGATAPTYRYEAFADLYR